MKATQASARHADPPARHGGAVASIAPKAFLREISRSALRDESRSIGLEQPLQGSRLEGRPAGSWRSVAFVDSPDQAYFFGSAFSGAGATT